MTPIPLPNADLDVGRPLSARFAAQGAWTYRDAARLVWDLPVSAPRHPGLEAVLRDGTGTGPMKHALLAALAEEAGLPVDLWLGLYVVDVLNTPAVGQVLAAYGLKGFPEVHVVLGVGDERVDLTQPGQVRPVLAFREEERIRPDQIGAYATAWHRERLEAWAETQGLAPSTLWDARSEAIEAAARW